jgi:glutamate-ammonia-ligase adenylyltransferase
MSYVDTPSLLKELDAQRNFVAAQFDAVFSEKRNGGQASQDDEDTPAIQAALSGGDSLEAIESHLAELGFEDAHSAARRMLATWQSSRLQSLPEKSRNKLVALVNASLDLIVRAGGSHTATLNRLLDFLEAIARRAAYLALLTEYPQALERVIKMIATSSWTARYLTSHPILLDELLSHELDSPPDWPAFIRDCRQQLDAADGDTERQLDILREMHHAQLFRLLAQDLDGKLTVEKLADHLSALADALVELTIHAVWRTIPNRHRDVPRFAVIAYGKLGGKELGYASDLDVVFLYDDDDQDAPAFYAKLAQRFITWMTTHTSAGILFDIDIALRPDGASGLLVSSIGSFEKYQTTSAWVWEHQALTRARFCAGDAEIGARFESIREAVLRQPRDPEALKQEILVMRQKMRDAHPGQSELFDLKHDEGGMIDVEFLVQYLVLRHAAQYPQLTGDIGNIALLKLCGELDLIDSHLADCVANAYRRFRKFQHQARLQGEENARMDISVLSSEIQTVKALYRVIFFNENPDSPPLQQGK